MEVKRDSWNDIISQQKHKACYKMMKHYDQCQ
jgi:hypothetical protein